MKRLFFYISIGLALLPASVNAQVFSQNQEIIPPFVGVVYSTSTSLGAKLIATTSPTVGSITATSTATSTFAGGISAGIFNSASTTASSTFSNGLNLQSGCFSVKGSCLSSGGSTVPGGSNGQLQFNSSGTFGGASNTFYKNSNGYLGIGTTNPGAPIHLNIGSGTFTPVTDEAMILQRNQNTSDNLALTLVSGTSGSSLIRFATNANTEPGRIIYNQIQNSMAFQSNSAEAFRISSNQNMSINSADSDSPLHVVGKNAIMGQGLITDDGSGNITGDGSTTFFETLVTGDIITIPDTGETTRVVNVSDDNDMTVSPATSASNNSYTYNRGFRADDSSGQPLIKTTDSATTFYSPSSHPVEIDKCGQAPTPNSDSNAAFKIEVGLGCAGNEWTNLPTAAEGPGQSWTLGVTEDGAYKSGFSYLNNDGVLAMQTNIANPFSSTGLFLEPTNSFVGIETRAPITQLDVKGSGTNASPINIRAGTNLGTIGQSVALNFSESTGVVTTGSISNIAQDAHNIKLQFSTYNDAISGTATDKMDILGNGNVGIATSTPYSKLSVGGQVVAANYVATTTATSTFVGGIMASIFNATSTTASSTFSNGINLQNGCYSIKGTCLSTSGGATSPATPTKSVQFNNSGAFGGSSNFVWDNTNVRLGIGSSTPYSNLDIQGQQPADTFSPPTDADTVMTVIGGVGGGSLGDGGKGGGFDLVSGMGGASQNPATGHNGNGGDFYMATGLGGDASGSGDNQFGGSAGNFFFKGGTGGGAFDGIGGTGGSLSFLGGRGGNALLNDGGGDAGSGGAGGNIILTGGNGGIAGQYNIPTPPHGGNVTISAGYPGLGGAQSPGPATTTFPGYIQLLIGKVGVGTSTPWANLSVLGTTTENVPTFLVASSTGSTMFTVLANGNTGVATTTPNATLTVKGSMAINTRVVSGSASVATSTDNVILETLTSSPSTITLPLCNATLAGPASIEYEIKDAGGNASTNNITVARVASDTIDGATSKVINTNSGAFSFVCYQTGKWAII